METKLINFKNEIFNKENMLISFYLNNYCNYCCSYCSNMTDKERILSKCFLKTNNKYFKKKLYKKIYENKIYNFNIEYFDNIFNQIKKIYFNFFKKDSTIKVDLLGGEPTLYKDLNKIIEKLSNFDFIKIYLITNGSKPIDFFKKLIENFNNIYLYISVQSENGNINHYYDLYLLFKDINYNKYMFDMVLTNNNVEKIFEYIDKFNELYKQNKFSISDNKEEILNDELKTLFNNKAPKSSNYILEYSNGTIKNINKNVFHELQMKNNIFFGMNCNSYKKLSIIDNDISYFGCKHKSTMENDFVYYSKDNHSLIDKFILNKNNYKCNYNKKCIVSSDLIYRKYL